LGCLLTFGGVTFGAVMTLRQVHAHREGHTVDLFTKAIDQLAGQCAGLVREVDQTEAGDHRIERGRVNVESLTLAAPR
jgi:hypothetical protein